jgi:hypothetical protein
MRQPRRMSGASLCFDLYIQYSSWNETKLQTSGARANLKISLRQTKNLVRKVLARPRYFFVHLLSISFANLSASVLSRYMVIAIRRFLTCTLRTFVPPCRCNVMFFVFAMLWISFSLVFGESGIISRFEETLYFMSSLRANFG